MTWNPALTHFDAFYRSGALVFGGGHVVLPLLHEAVATPGWISEDVFLAGYGTAQAMPGPLFTFAAFLGAALNEAPNGILGAALALVAIFLPGLLALVGVMPFWNELHGHAGAKAAIAGANAAVVGILGAALYNPVWKSTVNGMVDIVAIAMGFAMLTLFRVPPIVVVALGAAAGVFDLVPS
jgi:chromate transporter